eukprot:1149142-Pelagomonas_calceolata.AAC.6
MRDIHEHMLLSLEFGGRTGIRKQTREGRLAGRERPQTEMASMEMESMDMANKGWDKAGRGRP